MNKRLINRLVIVMLVALFSLSAAIPVSAVTQNDVDNAKKKVSDTSSSLSKTAAEFAKAVQEVEALKKEIEVAKLNIIKTKKEISVLKDQIGNRAVKVYTNKEDDTATGSLKEEEKKYLTESVVGSEEDILIKLGYLEESLAEQKKILDDKKQQQDVLVKNLEEQQKKLQAALDEARKNEANITEQLKKEEAARKAAEAARKAQEAAMAAYNAAKAKAKASGGSSGYANVAPPSAPLVVSGSGLFLFPTSGVITSGFGPRSGCGVCSRYHKGIDIAGPTGTPIYAAANGVVSQAGWNGGYGNSVTILHGSGYSTLYGHQSRIVAAPGQVVTRGQLIGYIGSTGNSTGPHLHFEVMINGTKVNPLFYL